MKNIKNYIAAIFAPHDVPAPFQNIDAFGFVDDDRIFPFDDCNLPAITDLPLEAWSGDKKKAALIASQVHVWLHGSSGCLYGFWSHDGRAMIEAPIVYLCDEGCENGVVANNLDEFLSIAANGFSRITPTWCEPDLEELEEEETEAFFVARGIKPADDVEALIKAASEAHPDFDAWLNEQLGEA